MVIGIVSVRLRPEGYEETLSIEREGQIAGDVSSGWKAGDDCLRVACGAKVIALVGKAKHGGRVGDVEPFGVIAGRVERHPKDRAEASGEHPFEKRFAI